MLSPTSNCLLDVLGGNQKTPRFRPGFKNVYFSPKLIRVKGCPMLRSIMAQSSSYGITGCSQPVCTVTGGEASGEASASGGA